MEPINEDFGGKEMNELMVLNVEELNMKSSFAQAKKTLTKSLKMIKALWLHLKRLTLAKKELLF